MWKTWAELKISIKGKKVIFWGRGEWIDKTKPYANFDIECIIDNNINEQGTLEHGLNIVGPDKLNEIYENKESYFIVITTTDFYNVSEQLKKSNFVEGVNFCVTPAQQNIRILSDIRSFSKKVIFSSSDPVDDSKVKGGGIYIYDTLTMTYEKKVFGVTQGFGKIDDKWYVVDDVIGIRIFNIDFSVELERVELPKKSRPHGVSIDKINGLIYIAFSTMDAVGVFDVNKKKIINKINISEKFSLQGSASHHINDLCVFEDSLFVSMFSISGNWKKSVFDGGIIEYNLKSDRVVGPVVSNLWMPHSVKMIDGNLCYCDSMRGNFHITTHKVESTFNGFIRGLDYDGQFYIIGQSVHRYFDRMKGFSNNIALDTGFFIFDSDSKGCRFYSVPHILDIHTLEILAD